jgi:hypothetical protein
MVRSEALEFGVSGAQHLCAQAARCEPDLCILIAKCKLRSTYFACVDAGYQQPVRAQPASGRSAQTACQPRAASMPPR